MTGTIFQTGPSPSPRQCPRRGCDEVVRLRRATEMPTVKNAAEGEKVLWKVRYCDAGHVLEYRPYREPLPDHKLWAGKDNKFTIDK